MTHPAELLSLLTARGVRMDGDQIRVSDDGFENERARLDETWEEA